MVEEREVSANLKITKEGDVGAFKETSGDIEKLGEEASSAAPKMESFGGSAAGSSEQVAGMAAAAGKAFAVMQAAGAILESAAEGAKILGEAYGGLSDDTSALVDDVGALGKSLSSLDVMGTAAALGRTLGDAFNSLTDAAKSTVVVNAELVGKMTEQREHMLAVIAIQKELVESERQRVEKLNLTAEALARQAAVEQSAGEISKATAEQIKANVAAYGSIPAPLAAAAASLGILSAAEKKAADDAKAAAEQHKEAVQGIVSEITGIPAKVGPPLAELSKTLGDALSKIDFSQLNPAQLDRAKSIMQQFIDTSRQAGQQIPEYIADQAASLGILVAAMEVAGTANQGLRGAQAALEGVVVGTSQTFSAQGQELSRLTTITNQAGAAAKAGGAQIKEGAEEAGKGAKPVQELETHIDSIGEAFRKMGSGAKAAGGEVKEGADKAGDSKKALEETGKAAGDAGTGLAAAATGASGLGPAAGTAKAGVESLKGPLEQVKEPAAGAATALTSVEAAATKLNGMKFDGFIASLKAVETQAKATKAAVDSIDAPGGAAPSPGDSSSPGDTGGGGGGAF